MDSNGLEFYAFLESAVFNPRHALTNERHLIRSITSSINRSNLGASVSVTNIRPRTGLRNRLGNRIPALLRIDIKLSETYTNLLPGVGYFLVKSLLEESIHSLRPKFECIYPSKR